MNSLGAMARRYSYSLQIRPKYPLGLIVGMTDIIA